MAGDATSLFKSNAGGGVGEGPQMRIKRKKRLVHVLSRAEYRSRRKQ